MKIAVYAICKNEEKHINKWYDSIKEADEIVVLDTGSTDNSVELLISLGVHVIIQEITPWDFSAARNSALDMVSDDVDVCLSLDLDEIMVSGWREALEKVWVGGVTEVRYPYVFNWNDTACTIPRITMYNFKIHARHGYSWHYPVHEIVCADDESECVSIICEDIQCLHYADPTKKRDYQALLDQACIDDPEEQRYSHLRGRELWMYNRFEEAIVELERHLTLKSDPQTRALSYRYIGRCLKAIHASPDEVLVAMLHNVAESPYQRESWIWLAQAWMDCGDYPQAYACAQTGMRITDRAASFENEEGCWGEIPHMISAKALSMMKGVV